MSSYAAHPYTTQLFMNYALSVPGQKAVASTNRSPVMAGLNLPQSADNLVPKNYPVAPYSTIAGFVYNPTPYTKIWDQLWPS